MQLSVTPNNKNSVKSEVSGRLSCQAETRETSPDTERVIISQVETFFSVLCLSERNIIPI